MAQSTLGILLGSFDPIHIGHMNAAAYALETSVSEVWFVVAKQNPWKSKQATDFDLRCKMIEKTIETSNLNCKVCKIEKNIEPPVYSYITLSKLREAYPNYKFSLIIGTDVANSIHKWKEYENHIKPFFDFIVVPRSEEDVSSTMIRDLVKNGNSELTPLVTKEVEEIIKENNLYK